MPVWRCLFVALLFGGPGCFSFPDHLVVRDGGTEDTAVSDGGRGDTARGDAGTVVDGPRTDGRNDATAGGPVVRELLADPFGDQSPFAFVFHYDGKIYLGPNKRGDGAVRVEPDGSSPQSVAFAFPSDTNDNGTANKASPPFPSIGYSGCGADTNQCGPDNEDSRGIFAAGSIGGQEWLVIVGGRTAGDLDYVYMSSDVDPTLEFRYVDLSTLLGGQTKGSSAAHFFGNRLYLGFPDTGGKRPYLVVVKAPPSAPGLDVSSTAEAENLQAADMPGIGGSASSSMIDAITDFNDRIYIFNNGGCIRSTTATPSPYDTNPADWAVCSPTAAAYSEKTAIAIAKVVDIEPADKAFPQLAVFKGRLYAGRNTADGPQLWVCAPALSGDTAQCDPADWSLLAANTVGDAALSQFNSASNVKVSLVIATPTHLYVGFDNDNDGVVLFRSDKAAPTALADFAGQDGCSAAMHPSGCQGLGGNGFGGAASTTRILDGMALSSSDAVYLTAGNGTSAARVYRISAP